MLSRAIPQKDEDGRIQMWVGTSTDIQDIKEMDQQKDSFLSMASHELKTPVTTIKAYGQIAEALLEKKGDTETLALIKKMGTQVNRLTNLIGDLLDITRIQKGKLHYNEGFFEINDVVKEVVDDMQKTSGTHHIQYIPDDNEKIYGDQEKISQVLNNLISNAIKYSPQADKIIVGTHLKDNGVEISIKDFGIGIPSKEQHLVFEQFYRVTGNNQSTFPGMGIGLFICSEITKMHGGKIWADSGLGEGSTFHVWLPKDHRSIE
jgi:signal transduction histidine kinase